MVVFAALGQAAGGLLVLGWAYAGSDWLRQDEKDQIGLDQFVCRRYIAVQRHLILTAIKHLLLTRLRLKLIDQGWEPGGTTPDRTAGGSGRGRVDPSGLADAARPTQTLAAHR